MLCRGFGIKGRSLTAGGKESVSCISIPYDSGFHKVCFSLLLFSHIEPSVGLAVTY